MSHAFRMKRQLVFADEAIATELFADLTRDATSSSISGVVAETRYDE